MSAKNLADVQQIALVVSAKFPAIRMATRLFEEHAGTYTSDRSLVHQDVIVNLIVLEISRRRAENPDAVAQDVLKSRFELAKALCAGAFQKKLEDHKQLRTLYKRQILSNKKLNTIFHKSPNEVQLDYKLGAVRKAFIAANGRSPSNFVSDDWKIFISPFKECLEQINALNDEMASVLERVEKYSDDKARLWLAVSAIILTLVFQAAWPGIKALPWNEWGNGAYQLGARIATYSLLAVWRG